MKRHEEPISVDDRGNETHPTWGLARFNRASYSPPGASLFDSSIKHHQVVTFEVNYASREHNLNNDWLFPRSSILEMRMSMANFGGLVSSFGDGTGVPVTLEHVIGTKMPGLPVEISPLERTAAETGEAMAKALAKVQTADAMLQEALAEKPPKIGKIRAAASTLSRHISQAPGNVDYASRTLTEHSETVVAKARADIEGMVDNRARELGLNRGDLGALELGS